MGSASFSTAVMEGEPTVDGQVQFCVSLELQKYSTRTMASQIDPLRTNSTALMPVRDDGGDHGNGSREAPNARGNRSDEAHWIARSRDLIP